MPQLDPRVDAYIDTAPEYAKPILVKLRKAILSADANLAEQIKWGAPTFDRDGMVCSFNAFKQHVAVWFYKGALLADPDEVLIPGKTVAMRAIHYKDAKEVQPKPLKALVAQAVKLNLEGVKAPKKSKTVKVPRELGAALDENARARKAFDALPPSHQREYVEWVSEAKRSETKERRLAETVARLSRGQRMGQPAAQPKAKRSPRSKTRV